MSLAHKPIEDLKFSDLRVHYGTGRSFLISGTGRDKKYGYRHGMMTDLGDLEISEWKALITALIEYHGEQELQEQLLQWCRDGGWPSRKDELEAHALELHAARLFDNPAWADYIPFNRKYRPEVLGSADLVWIQNQCCGNVRQVTRVQFENLSSKGNSAVYCHTCGDWTAVALAEIPTTGKSEHT